MAHTRPETWFSQFHFAWPDRDWSQEKPSTAGLQASSWSKAGSLIIRGYGLVPALFSHQQAYADKAAYSWLRAGNQALPKAARIIRHRYPMSKSPNHNAHRAETAISAVLGRLQWPSAYRDIVILPPMARYPAPSPDEPVQAMPPIPHHG